MKFVVDVVLSLDIEELTNLKKLADKQGTSVEGVARLCMNTKCKELLDAAVITTSPDQKLIDVIN